MIKINYQTGSILPTTLLASVVISFLTLTGIYLLPINLTDADASLYISPKAQTLTTGEEFSIQVEVAAKVPVNVFTGLIHFNPQVLSVVKIDYNTSVADLWTEEPWYQNGDGTIGFAGGTYQSGGFVGTDNLMIITFKAESPGKADIRIDDARILKHDGAGTDANLSEEMTTLYTILDSANTVVLIDKISGSADVVITNHKSKTDLNNDGSTTISDLSIFMLQLSTQNRQSDFNGDGKINATDLSILMQSL